MSLRLENISISLQGNERTLVQPFSFEVASGEIVTLMGPSGSGKSSLLSAISGNLAAPMTMTGCVVINGHDVTSLPSERRRIGRLFQDDLLFPHMTVGENLLFGIPRGPGRVGAMEAGLREIELDGFEDRPPHTLSGGQRQRVSLLRSLLAQPDCMLLDEPFSKLDTALREAIQSSTFELLMRRQTPTLLVTHDVADAPKGSRILKIENGKVTDV